MRSHSVISPLRNVEQHNIAPTNPTTAAKTAATLDIKNAMNVSPVVDFMVSEIIVEAEALQRTAVKIGLRHPSMHIGELLPVFRPRLYIQVCHLDEPCERSAVYGRSRPQLHMAHKLASALQQASRIRQRRTLKEPHVDMRSEYIHIAEGHIPQARNRTAIMQQLPNFVPTSSHHLKPLMRDGPQFPSMLVHPRIDGRIAFHSSVESQQLRSRPSRFCIRDQLAHLSSLSLTRNLPPMEASLC